MHPALAALPHGPEFRFVDDLTDLTPGQSATGTYLLRPEASFLAGHFPGQPILPAVLMVEAIAQLAGVAAQSDPAIPALPGLRLTAIRGVKIYGTAVPGETLSLHATVQGRMGPLIQAAGKVSVGDRLIAEGQVTLSGS
ncbi:MAG: beta-hydroxyacyl-ACP dehydratase [Verrucomicrobiales bacterium]|nr:beta-hydroxyacyl-ACP dehydratase [Verrucomicrobiales bacterium]MCP5556914.1 beta-hydroxyacyl-ACP dehydratase [Verrucomicrobiaceae bacterium]